MIYQRQVTNECMLTAVCNTLNIPLTLVHDILDSVGLVWERMMRDLEHVSTTEVIAMLYPAADSNALFGFIAGWKLGEIPPPELPGAMPWYVLPLYIPALPTTGRGVLIVRAENGRRHALSYDSGLIVDPNFPNTLLTESELSEHMYHRYGCVYLLEDWLPMP